MTAPTLTPRGTTPKPTFIILVDDAVQSASYADWFSYDMISMFPASQVGEAFGAAYGISGAAYRGWARFTWPSANLTPAAIVNGLLDQFSIAPDNSLLLVVLMTPEHSQIDPATGVLGYHDATPRVPFIWLPYAPDGAMGLGGRDLLTLVLSHEWMEACTDTFPFTGVLPGGQEVGDPCIQSRYRMQGSSGYTYVTQSFAQPDGTCWAGAAEGHLIMTAALEERHFHLPKHLLRRILQHGEPKTPGALTTEPPPRPR